MSLLFHFKNRLAFLMLVSIMLVAVYVHLVVKNPMAFPGTWF
jgi:hypothetical protein